MKTLLHLKKHQISKKEQQRVNGGEGDTGACVSTCIGVCDHFIPVINGLFDPDYHERYEDNKKCVQECRSFC